MRGITAKRLRKIAHTYAENYIGQPHYVAKFKDRLVQILRFGKHVPIAQYQGKTFYTKNTIYCQGTRRIYRDLKRRFKQARTRWQKRLILEKITIQGTLDEISQISE